MAETREELLSALQALFDVLEDTVEQLEEESPGLAECGYWNRDQIEAYNRARDILYRIPEGWEILNEGYFRSRAEAEEFGAAEVGVPWRVGFSDCSWRVLVQRDWTQEEIMRREG